MSETKSENSEDAEMDTSLGGESTSNTNSSQEAEAIMKATFYIGTRNRMAGSSPKEGERSQSASPAASSDEEEEDDAMLGTSTSRNASRSGSINGPHVQSSSRLPTAETMAVAVANMMTLALCMIVFGLFLVGSYDYFKNVEGNKCDMTWMYQHPYYVPIPVGSGVEIKYPKYRLYAYVEGEEALESRPNRRFTGIPVLYIPGNAGSYQQVRSLASVALWKHIDASTPFNFDFFTVDLNEEFSALYGFALERHTEYTRKALEKIASLYEDFHRVVLVGHSMGGIIAKAVALDERGKGQVVSNLILTLATPHSNPVAILDPNLDLFYYGLARNWTKLVDPDADSPSSSKVTLVSIAGGDRDVLVQPRLTRWFPYTDILTSTTAIPGVWASADHLCIVWCKQLVLTIVRALFDLVELHPRNKYYMITENRRTRQSVLNYHLVERSSGKTFYSSPKNGNLIALPKNIEQTEVSGGMFCLRGGSKPSFALFPVSFLSGNLKDDDSLEEDVLSYRVIVLTTNTKERNWILGCIDFEGGKCHQAENLAHFGKIIPHMKRRRKMATLQLSTLISKYSHLVIKMDSHPVKTCVMLESYSESQRTLPLLGSLIQVGNNKIFYKFTLDPTAHSSSTLGGLIFHLMAWKVDVKPMQIEGDEGSQSQNQSCPESHNLLATFSHGNFEYTRFPKNESLIVRFADWNTTNAMVSLYMEPTCNYSVNVAFAPLETAGQFFRQMFKILPSFYASVIMMTFYYQKDGENWSSFHVVLLSNVYNLSVFPGFCVAVLLHFLPSDWPLIMEPGEYSVVFPILLYMTAYCLVLAVSTGIWYVIITGGTAVHSVIVQVISNRFESWMPRLFSKYRGFTSVREHVMEAAFELSMSKYPLLIGVSLMALAYVTCGGLAISLCVVLYLVKLFKMYEDLMEDLLKAKIAGMKENLTPMHFHFSCFMLWIVIGVLNLPAMLHWTRAGLVVNLGGQSQPQPQWDLSLYLCPLLLPTVPILWQEFVPKIEPLLWTLHRYIFFVMGLSCVIWGSHRLYVTAFLIVFVLLTMALCQLLTVIMGNLRRMGEDNSQDSPSETSPSQATVSRAEAPSSSKKKSKSNAKKRGKATASASSATATTSKVNPGPSKDDLGNDPKPHSN